MSDAKERIDRAIADLLHRGGGTAEGCRVVGRSERERAARTRRIKCARRAQGAKRKAGAP